ncbi:MAG TPA: sugar ABC transporter permease [candidate division Zixibacteria bacterium]|nr:sugar ABC transporter permease [candidate division Zixibacteria bacterium]MDD4918655.1 sugar ABC transporter permease [candidate division Zixibacteria bacterium]MDM7971731.1 sugar ABC transporter permease [candidate division Zixibacteria bacterium]HOD67004.1 sugar ABC transporter permease [candidate division Zixibacteria bacterium]HOZ07552.1 sugar ABC transporter permease [candidate division Zixibacteria bacterium]
MRRSRLTALLLLSPWILSFAVFWLFPLVYSLVMGFTDYRLLAPAWRWIGLANYRSLLADESFLAAVENTFIFVLGTVPVTTVIALGLALLVNRQFPGRGLFRAGYFIPSITSMVVVALIFTNLYQRGGYIAALAAMVGLPAPEHGFLFSDKTALASIMAMDVWMAVGYYMLIFLAGLKSIPDELYEAARIQGAGRARQFFSITLPLLRPVALFIVVINSIKSFQVFVEIFVMTKGKFDTASMVYFIYDAGLTTAFRFGYASAAAYLLFLIIAVFSVVQFALLRRRQPLW